LSFSVSQKQEVMEHLLWVALSSAGLSYAFGVEFGYARDAQQSGRAFSTVFLQSSRGLWLAFLA
jgi:hypothetical protein